MKKHKISHTYHFFSSLRSHFERLFAAPLIKEAAFYSFSTANKNDNSLYHYLPPKSLPIIGILDSGFPELLPVWFAAGCLAEVWLAAADDDGGGGGVGVCFAAVPFEVVVTLTGVVVWLIVVLA